MSFAKTLDKVMRDRNLKSCDIVCDEITAQYLSKLRNGKVKDPTWGKACAIIDKLGMGIEEFRATETSLCS